MLLTEYMIILTGYNTLHFIKRQTPSLGVKTFPYPVFDSAPSLDEVQWFCPR